MQEKIGIALFSPTGNSLRGLFAAGMVAWLLCLNAVGQLAVDPALKPYKAVPGVSGQLKSVGSDSMNPLMLLWTEKFKTYYKGFGPRSKGRGRRKLCRP